MKTTCVRCGVEKDSDLFCTGKPRLCLECHRISSRNHRKSDKGRATIQAYSKKRYQRTSDKSLARAKLRQAVEKGLIVKPQVCEDCPRAYGIEGHHDDYSKPLEVRWLCKMCHLVTHKRIKDTSLLLTGGSPHDTTA